MKPREIAERLADSALEIARYLLPNGQEKRGEWLVGDLNGEQGKSLHVQLEGPRRGLWHDFATGDGGDLLHLWGKTRNLRTSDAMREAREYLGLPFTSMEKDYALPEIKTKGSPTAGKVKGYLEKRGISKAIQDKFGVYEYSDHCVFRYLLDGKVIFAKYRNYKDKKDTYTAKGGKGILYGWTL